MKILFSNGTRDWGGEKSWALETASCLLGRGHESMMLGRPGDAWLDACREAGLKTCEVHFGPFIFAPGNVAGFYRAARDFRPDCIVVNISYDMCAGAAAGALLGIPVLRHVGLAEDLNHDPVDRWLHTRRLRGTIAVGHQMKREMLEEYRWLDDAHIEVIHIGKDVELYRPEPRGEARKEWGFPEDALLVGVTSQLAERKGHSVLFEALSKLDDERMQLVVVGRGSQQEQLEDLARTLGVSNRVRFLGFRRDLPLLLRSFDAFALPSFSEGFPNSLVEAMATGLPCISTDLACVSEILVHGRNGLLVPAGDAGALAAALGRILSEPELRRSLGAEARRVVEERFSLAAATDHFEAYVSRIIGGPGTESTAAVGSRQGEDRLPAELRGRASRYRLDA